MMVVGLPGATGRTRKKSLRHTAPPAPSTRAPDPSHLAELRHTSISSRPIPYPYAILITNRLRKDYINTPDFYWSARLGQQEYAPRRRLKKAVRVVREM